MSSIVINGDTSGSVTLQAPAIAGSTVVTLPTTSMNIGTGGGSVATNTAFGASALAANTTGANNVSLGYLASDGNTTGIQNVAVGSLALRANTTAGQSVAVGYQAARLQTGGSNVAVGFNSLLGSAGVSTGTSNTAIGTQALLSNTTASNNTAVGYQAGYSNTTGTSNVALGYQAGYANTTGNESTAVGTSSLRQSTTGVQNCAFGTETLYSNTTASGNSAFGTQALTSNTSGASNVAVGFRALNFNTTASSNTAVGYQAGYTNVTGVGNTFIGDKAGYTSNGTGNAYNTCVGQSAGYSLTTGVSNTFIGVSATASASGALITTGSRNSILGPYSGNQGSLDIRTASNYIVLSDGDGNPRGFFNDTGYLKVAPSAGDLNGITGTYHEIVTSSAGGNALRLRQANASFNDTIFRVASNRTTTNNSYYFMDCLDQGAATKFRIADSGNVTNTNNSYGAISDAKLKENITDATPKLDKLNQVRVVNYNLIGDEKKQLGVIAQELEQIFPSIVDETADRDEEGNDLGTTTKSVKYSVFVPMLIKAIQEQQALITSLTTRITALEAKVGA
jgi:hypothetical protein